MADYKYDVALSFATEDRSYVVEVHRGLTALGIKTFYDESVQESIWSDSVSEYLDKVFGNQARFCVVFLSKNYIQKAWTQRELKAMQGRQHRHFLLPVRMDNTPTDGVDTDLGYLRARDYKPRELANKIAEKLGLSIHDQALRTRSQLLANPVRIQFATPLDIDIDLLLESLRPFLAWAQQNAFSIPCEVILPPELKRYRDAVVEGLQNNGNLSEYERSVAQFFAQGLQSLTERISQGVRAAAFTVIGVRSNRSAQRDISDVELRSIAGTYVTATAANFIFDLMSHRIEKIEVPFWLPQFYDVTRDVGDTFYRGLAFALKNTADELLFWTNAGMYFEANFRLTKHIYIPSRMLLYGHRDVPSREHFVKFVAPQLIHIALQSKDDKFNLAILQSVATFPERLSIRPQGKYFIELDHLKQLSNSAAEIQHLRETVETHLRDLIRRGQFEDFEARYQHYEPEEREQVVFEHVMLVFDSILRAG